MLQILLMNYGVRKMLLITRAILRSHFQRVENMNLRTGTSIPSGKGVMRSE